MDEIQKQKQCKTRKLILPSRHVGHTSSSSVVEYKYPSSEFVLAIESLTEDLMFSPLSPFCGWSFHLPAAPQAEFDSGPLLLLRGCDSSGEWLEPFSS